MRKRVCHLLLISGLLWPVSAISQERIISLAPHITELLFSVGAGEEVVGVMSYSNYPEAANEIPVIGSNDKLNYEQIISLRPTLVVGWEGGNNSDALDRLRTLGMRVESHNPHTLEDVGESLRWAGEISGHPVEGRAASRQYFERLSLLRRTYADKTGMSVYYQVWNEPQMTVNDEHLISDVMRLCGGQNVFADAIPLVPRVSMESVLQRNPEVIIMAGEPGAQPDRLAGWQRWDSMQAVTNGHLYEIHPDLLHRHSDRILEGAEKLCLALEDARSNMEDQ